MIVKTVEWLYKARLWNCCPMLKLCNNCPMLKLCNDCPMLKLCNDCPMLKLCNDCPLLKLIFLRSNCHNRFTIAMLGSSAPCEHQNTKYNMGSLFWLISARCTRNEIFLFFFNIRPGKNKNWDCLMKNIFKKIYIKKFKFNTKDFSS